MSNDTSAVPSLSPVAPSLASRLKTETADLHESMHVLMGRLAPFSARNRYVRFVAAQFVFQSRVSALAQASDAGAIIADLSMRFRVGAARADLSDLSAELAPDRLAWALEAAAAAAAPVVPVSSARALGWLYVSEGSTLGAAFLFKEAQTVLGLTADFGARNLAASPTGRALSWRAFVVSLDAAELTADQADQVVAGAHEAFSFFGAALTDAFEGAPDVSQPADQAL